MSSKERKKKKLPKIATTRLLPTSFSRVVNYDDYFRKQDFLVWLYYTATKSQSKMSEIRKIPQQGGATNSIDTSFQVLTFWPRIFLRFKVKIYVEINARVMVTRTGIETSWKENEKGSSRLAIWPIARDKFRNGRNINFNIKNYAKRSRF